MPDVIAEVEQLRQEFVAPTYTIQNSSTSSDIFFKLGILVELYQLHSLLILQIVLLLNLHYVQ